MHERLLSLHATLCRHMGNDTSVFNSKAECYSNQRVSDGFGVGSGKLIFVADA